jgi:hypothetical protein
MAVAACPNFPISQYEDILVHGPKDVRAKEHWGRRLIQTVMASGACEYNQ